MYSYLILNSMTCMRRAYEIALWDFARFTPHLWLYYRGTKSHDISERGVTPRKRRCLELFQQLEASFHTSFNTFINFGFPWPS